MEKTREYIDAFRHAYVSGVYTQVYNDLVANLLGRLNEAYADLSHNQPKEEKNMDLWNNNVGRKYGDETTSREDLASVIKKALENNELITDAKEKDQSKQYKGKYVPYIIPVKVIEESETTRNIRFMDMLTKRTMSREQFVSEIEAGNYPGYGVAMMYGLATPIGAPGNKLG